MKNIGSKLKNGIALSLLRMKNKDNNARRGIAREYPEMHKSCNML